MKEDLDQLETELLLLGRQELEIELRLQQLKQECRALGLAGRHDEADLAWALLVEARGVLDALQVKITKIETRLYGARRGRNQ